jgi:hypothetical protein
LPFASGSRPSGPAQVLHLISDMHAWHTKGGKRQLPLAPFGLDARYALRPFSCTPGSCRWGV